MTGAKINNWLGSENKRASETGQLVLSSRRGCHEDREGQQIIRRDNGYKHKK